MKTSLLQTAERSLSDVKQVRNLVTISLLVAVGFVLRFFTLNLTPMLRINFKYLVSCVVGMLYGPVAGAMYGGISDILGYFVDTSGNAYFVGFTLIAIIGGVLNGYLYYGKEITWKRVIIGRIVVALICQVILNTWCLSLLMSKYFWAMLPLRFIKSLVMLPLEIVLLHVVMTMVQKIQKRSHS